MSDRKTRICALCKTQYEYCPQCSRADEKKPTWYFTFCSENCHDIYNVTSGFESGRIKGVDAKAQLEKLDLSKLVNFGQSYKLSIDEINNVVIPQPVVKVKSVKESTEKTEQVETETNETKPVEKVETKKDKKVVKKPKEKEADDVE